MNLARYRTLFLDEARERLARLARGLAAGALTPALAGELEREAHTLKGMAAAMQLEPIRRLAAAIEARLAGARCGERPVGNGDREALQLAAARLELQLEAYGLDQPLPDGDEPLRRLEEETAPPTGSRR